MHRNIQVFDTRCWVDFSGAATDPVSVCHLFCHPSCRTVALTWRFDGWPSYPCSFCAVLSGAKKDLWSAENQGSVLPNS